LQRELRAVLRHIGFLHGHHDLAGCHAHALRRLGVIASGIGPPDPKAGRRPPLIRTSAINASGSSGLWFHCILECMMRAGNKGKTLSMPWNRSQFGLLLRLRRCSHLRHNFATSYRSRDSMRMFPVTP
jgi:hypothetical protein